MLIHVHRAIVGSGGLAVGLYYLLPPQIERWNRPKGSGHGGHGHGHDEHGGESEGGGEGVAHEGEDSGEKGDDDGAEGENESKEGGEESEQSDDSGSEGGENDTPDTSGDEDNVVDSGKNVEGVQFKGPSNAGPNKQQTDTRRSYPDAKGGNKKRIESHYGQKQGVAGDSEQDPKDKDLVYSKNPPPDKQWVQLSNNIHLRALLQRLLMIHQRLQRLVNRKGCPIPTQSIQRMSPIVQRRAPKEKAL